MDKTVIGVWIYVVCLLGLIILSCLILLSKIIIGIVLIIVGLITLIGLPFVATWIFEKFDKEEK